MMRAENRGITSEIIEIVHNDSDEKIQHKEGTEEDEGHKVDVGNVGAARVFRVLVLAGLRITWPTGTTGQHDCLPGLAGSTSRENQGEEQMKKVLVMLERMIRR